MRILLGRPRFGVSESLDDAKVYFFHLRFRQYTRFFGVQSKAALGAPGLKSVKPHAKGLCRRHSRDT